MPASSPPSEYEFDQLVAEAVHRVGQPVVAEYLSAAARDFGWPIPPRHRARVSAALSALVLRIEAKTATQH